MTLHPLARLLLPVASAGAFAAASAALDPGLWRAGGSRLTDDEQGAVIGAVVDFQRAYQDFFASGGQTAVLDACPATRAAKHLVFTDIGFLREAGMVLVQDFAQGTVLETRRTGPDAAEVLVYEEWNYVYRKVADRGVASDLKGLGQGLRYRLRREGGRWLVDGWVPEDVPHPEDDAGFTW